MRNIETFSGLARIGFVNILVDFDNKIEDGFTIKVNPAEIVYPQNNLIKSSAVSTIWAV